MMYKNMKLFAIVLSIALMSVAAFPAGAIINPNQPSLPVLNGCDSLPIELSDNDNGGLPDGNDEIDASFQFEEGTILVWTGTFSFVTASSDDFDITIENESTTFVSQSFEPTGIVSGSFTIPATGVYDIYVSIDDDTNDGQSVLFTLSCAGGADLGPFAFDGRINDRDAAAPAVVYPREGGTAIEVLDVNGNRLLYVTASEIGAVGASPAQNTVIASGNGVVVSRASNGDFIVTAPQYNGKTYVLVFDVIASGVPYTSYEIE